MPSPPVLRTIETFDASRKHHWRNRLYTVIFGTDTPAGKRFDIALLCVIVASVVTVMLESVYEIRVNWGDQLHALEWGFTALFAVEYVLRLLAVRRPMRYATSFFGLIDLMAVLPTLLVFVVPAAAPLMTIRIIRMLRVFRILKLVSFLKEAQQLVVALRASRRKILVFLTSVLTLVVILGTLMYIIEDSASGFTSIPRSIYWAIVTLTTVGYGDIAPSSAIGQTVAAFIMILGYSIIAVPTGIVSSELTKVSNQAQASFRTCSVCMSGQHEQSARFCKDCGSAFESVK